MDITEKLNSIKTKADFVSFVELLSEDLRGNIGEWENKMLPEFLEAISSWTEDMEGYHTNNDLPESGHVNCKAFAGILVAARYWSFV